MSKVPKILHQIWYQGADKVPDKYKHMQEKWKNLHCHWTYKCWDSRSIQQLVHDHYPEYEAMYNGLQPMILKIDVAKYFILHYHGGVYLDLDIDCIRCLDSLFDDGYELYLPEMKIDQGVAMWVVTLGRFSTGNYWNNEFLASCPGHRYWTDLLLQINEDKDKFYMNRWFKVLNLAGPSMVTRVAREKGYDQMSTTRSCPVYFFEPYDMYTTGGADISRSYGIHRFANSWMPWPMRLVNFLYFNPMKTMTILVVAFALYHFISTY